MLHRCIKADGEPISDASRHHALKKKKKKICSHSTLEVKVRRRTGCFGLTGISEMGSCAVGTDTYGMLLDRRKMKITLENKMYRSNTSKGHFFTKENARLQSAV